MADIDTEIRQYACDILKCSEANSLDISLIVKGGSDRTFRRIRFGDDRSVIFMHYNAEREENRYYAAIAGFLRDLGLTVPAIFHHDPARCFILMEDLGDIDLWSFRRSSWERRCIYYRKVLLMIRKLHRFPLENLDRWSVSLMEGFGPALYRWERDYFRENFVRNICGISPGPTEAEALEAELDALAGRIQKSGAGLVHRDFQSQNILIHEKEPALIDFQGLRTGSYFYDLGSLLYDPYVSLGGQERLALLRYYYELDEDRTYGWETFQELFNEAAVQRLMQALGAYGYLGRQCDRREFLAHIPAGLERLAEAASKSPRLPLLRNLIDCCRMALKSSPIVQSRYTDENEGVY